MLAPCTIVYVLRGETSLIIINNYYLCLLPSFNIMHVTYMKFECLCMTVIHKYTLMKAVQSTVGMQVDATIKYVHTSILCVCVCVHIRIHNMDVCTYLSSMYLHTYSTTFIRSI